MQISGWNKTREYSVFLSDTPHYNGVSSSPFAPSHFFFFIIALLLVLLLYSGLLHSAKHYLVFSSPGTLTVSHEKNVWFGWASVIHRSQCCEFNSHNSTTWHIQEEIELSPSSVKLVRNNHRMWKNKKLWEDSKEGTFVHV